MALRDTITPVLSEFESDGWTLIMVKHKRLMEIVVLLPALLMAQDSVTQSRAGAEPLVLSLKQAIQLALAGGQNMTAQVAEQSVRLAEARSAQARAVLLPEVEATVSGQDQKLNLAALGFESIHIPVPGFTFPSSVGPFSTFDARVRVRQNLLDVSALRHSRAVRAGVQVAQADTAEVRDRVAGQVANGYIAVLRADAAAQAATAGVTLAEALLKQAEDRRDAGKGLEMDVTRAKAELAVERQRKLAAEIERTRARLQLLRSVGLSLDTRLELSDSLTFTPSEPLSPEKGLAVAFHSRTDLTALQQREENVRLHDDAIRSERWPSLAGYADYGALGTTVPNSVATYTVGVAVKVPVFDGGRREARRVETLHEMRQVQLREKDLRAQVELEVRQALERLKLAEQQVQVAEEGLAVARDELAQARRRYEAGVTGNLEVVEAQARLARSGDGRTDALYAWTAARLALFQSLGTIQELGR
jgi:outer membrane protein